MVGDEHDVGLRIGRAAAAQRLPRHQGHARRVRPTAPSRRNRDVADHDRQHAVVGQMRQIILKRLDGVQVTFREHVRAGRLGREGVDGRDLDDVVAVVVRPDIVPPFGGNQFHLGPRQHAARPIW